MYLLGIGVDGPDPGQLAGPVREVQQGDGGDGQGDPAGEPGRDHKGQRPGGRWGALLVGFVFPLGQGTGVNAEEEVHECSGAQLVHVPVQPGLAQLSGPGGDPLIGGQDLGWGQFPPGQPRVA